MALAFPNTLGLVSWFAFPRILRRKWKTSLNASNVTMPLRFTI